MDLTMTKPSTLEVVGEEGGAQESSERLQTFERRRVALTKKLESLTAQLESIQTEEVGIIGDDITGLVAELGEEEGLKDILASIVLSEDEIKGIETSISDVTAQAAQLEREGADFKARYGAERRVTKGMEILLASQKNEIFQEQKKIRELVTRIQDAKVARRSETEESITKVLETPMQSAVAIIVELLGKAERRGEMTVAMPLTKVLTQISAANLHTPKFRFDDATNSNMRQWIADTFAPAVRAKVAAAGDDAAEEDGGGGSGGGSAAVPEPELAGSAGSDEPTCSPRSLAPAANTLPRLHFNQFSFREEELGSLVRCMFEDLGFFEEFKLPMHTFDAFMVTMRRGYNSENQYHNYRHAIDVTQMSYYFCTQTSAANILSKWDIFLLIVCCIAHDVDHNGLTNAFHVNSQSPLALMYNDISVMENHHSSYFLNVLAREETNLLANCEESLRKEAKQKMVNIILSTDMANHFDVTNKFNLRVDAGVFGEKDEDGSPSEEDRTILSNLLMHASDLSNAVRPFPLARKWAYDIIEEFCAQGDLEASLTLPISPLCDRADVQTDAQKAKMQIGFLDYVVKPMYERMSTWITGMDACLANLAANRATYQTIKDEEKTLEEAEAEANEASLARVAAEDEAAAAAGAGTPSASQPAPAAAADDEEEEEEIEGDDV